MPKPTGTPTRNAANALGALLTHGWPCCEGTGTTVADLAPTGAIAGTLAGATWSTNAAGDPVVLGAADGQQINLASAITLTGDGWSIAWRAYQSSAGSTMPFGDDSGTANFVWYQNGTGLATRSNGTDGINGGVTAFTSQTDNYVLVSTSSVLKLYRNGVLVGADMTRGTSFSLKTLLQGYSSASFSLKGGFDYLWVFGGTALNATQAAALNTDPYQVYTTGGGGGTLPPSVTLTRPAAYQVFQRDATGTSASGRADLVITGTYTGTPGTIEASWNGGSFVTIVPAPAGGTFSSKLPRQAVGQGTLTIRLQDAGATLASTTVGNVGIGDVYLIAGQSNASGRGTSNQAYTATGSLDGGLFGNDNVWKAIADPTDSSSGQVDAVSADATAGGSVWPLVAATIAANTGVPVALIPCALGSTRVADWQPYTNHQDRTTLYGSAVYRALNCGSRGIRAILWWQGEQNAADGTTQAAYYASLASLTAAWRLDLGCPLVPCKLESYSTGVASQANQDAINAAIAQAWQQNPDVVAGPDLTGIATAPEDTVHLITDAKLAAAASLWWTALQTAFYPAGGGSPGAGGPTYSAF